MSSYVAVIGGGFYGCTIALHLSRRGYTKISLIEREHDLLTRASYRNQARVHNGCHYPRSYLTALRSRVNLSRFCKDYSFCVRTDFEMLYVIAGKRSKVLPRQFERFMHEIGAKYEVAGSGYASLFDPTQVAAIYAVEEYAFDACRLRDYFHHELPAAMVDVRLSTESIHVSPSAHDGRLRVDLKAGDRIGSLEADIVINCTHAGLNRAVSGGDTLTPGAHVLTPLKHELAELALVEVPPCMLKLGVTVMDGPFFSCMPFPPEQCHSLSHVRYTPHASFVDVDGRRDPVRELDNHVPTSRVDYMIADAARLMPCLRSSRWRKSLFETKTVLARSESDDGRPVLLRREDSHPRFFSVLGAKIDNIYDVLVKLDAVLAPQ